MVPAETRTMIEDKLSAGRDSTDLLDIAVTARSWDEFLARASETKCKEI